MSNVILFDIDYTLFDAKKYRDTFTYQLAEAFNLPQEEFALVADRVYQELRMEHAYFDPRLFIQKIEEETGKHMGNGIFEQMVIDEELLESSLYEDVIDVLTTLSSYSQLTLGIFSAGLHGIQRPKIKKVEHLLAKEHIHIYEFKKHHALPQLMEKYAGGEITMIDDRIDILALAKKLNPKTNTILIQRRDLPTPTLDNFTPDSIIKSLEEVLPLVLE